jgi:putative exosortase-associated protein (TIGR04073 family)
MNHSTCVHRIVFLSVFSLILLASSPLRADSNPPSNYTAAKKLHRGLHNGVTGWLDAPVTVDKFAKERNGFEAWTTGLARGVGLAIARTGAGIYEVATFPFAAPEKFEPVMMPEQV